MRIGDREYREIWCVDFEFTTPPGGRPRPICLVAWELVSGRRLHVGEDELLRMKSPPFNIGKESLYIAYYAAAEMGCHLALGWPLPANILDLCVEFKNISNGRSLPHGKGLLGALAFYGLDGIDAREKDKMTTLAMRGGPWTEQEHANLLVYCESDVSALARLLPMMARYIDLPRALLRGEFMKVIAKIEAWGIPFDSPTYTQIEEHRGQLQDRVIDLHGCGFGLYEDRVFKLDRWAKWLVENDIPWERTPMGRLVLDNNTFEEMAEIYPKVKPIQKLHATLAVIREPSLAVGADGRLRCPLWAFGTKTARNQPSTSEFIFFQPAWVRNLIRPFPGTGLGYIDYSQQEFGIAAALSRDSTMMAAYNMGDPYLAFAQQVGAIPHGATASSHAEVRERFKQVSLGILYGMGPAMLATRIGCTVGFAQELIKKHRAAFPRFWKWLEGTLDYAMLTGKLWTTFGWNIHAWEERKITTLINFPMQANGSEILRLACIWGIESGIRIIAPIHDAVLIEAPLEDLDEAVKRMQAIMERAGEVVLDGFKLRSEAKVIRYPERYRDPRGERMWATIMAILRDLGLIEPDHR